jgi:hypothetical protein
MNDRLHSFARDFIDAKRDERSARRAEVAMFDLEAQNATPDTWAAVDAVAQSLRDLGPQCHAADALVLLHAVWSYARRNSNQHQLAWDSFNTDVESAMRGLIYDINEERIEAEESL